MNRIVFNRIFETLKTHIENSSLNAKVYSKPSGDTYPMIVITPIENSSLDRSKNFEERKSLIGIEINIYTTPKVINEEYLDEIQISEYIQDEISNIMENHFSALRVTCQPTPNIDESLYRILMRYNLTISDFRNRIF